MKKIILIIVIACTFYPSQSQTTKRDKKFVECAAYANMMEIKLAELAQSNALRSEVKALALKLTDENKVSLKSVAEKNGIAYPTGLTESQQKMYNKMAELKGEAFDKHYTKCMVKSHKKLLCNFKKQAKKGSNVDLKEWAKTSIPTLENHKAVSQQACIVIKK